MQMSWFDMCENNFIVNCYFSVSSGYFNVYNFIQGTNIPFAEVSVVEHVLGKTLIYQVVFRYIPIYRIT